MKITVGIPAYNEAENIGGLLEAVFAQKLQNGASLCQVLVISDGSTDATPVVVSKWTKQDSRAELYQLPKRSGKPTAVNEIFRLARGDVIVLLDADTMPIGDNFLSEITKPFECDSKVGISAGIGIPLPPKRLVGRAAVFSSNTRRRLIWPRPYYAFNIALAVSAKTVKNLRLPLGIIGDDAYLYFTIKSQGLKTVVSRDAKILYREPQTLHDFIIQRKKYDKNVAQLHQRFGEIVWKEIRIPKKLWGVLLQEMLSDPIGGLTWLLLRGSLKLIRTMEDKKVTKRIAKSTKNALGAATEK